MLKYLPYSGINATSSTKNLDFLKYGYIDLIVKDDYSVTTDLLSDYTTTPYIDPTLSKQSFINIYYNYDYSVSLDFLQTYPIAAQSFLKLYVGVSRTSLFNENTSNNNVNNILGSNQLPPLSDNCFTWYEITSDQLPEEFPKVGPYIISYKYVIDLIEFQTWYAGNIDLTEHTNNLNGNSQYTFRLIIHLPVIVKANNITQPRFIYPQQLSKLKVIDRIVFDIGSSFVTTLKKFKVTFKDKDSDNTLLIYDSLLNSELFTVDRLKQLNFLYDKYEITDIGSISNIVTLNIPLKDQSILFNNLNYYVLLNTIETTG